MKTKANEQEMTEMVRDFIGGTIAPEKPKTEPQPAETQEQASEAVQQEMAMANEPMLGTPHQRQATPGIIGGIQGDLPSRSVHRRPQARVPQPQHARCP